MDKVILRPVCKADAEYILKNWAPDKLEGYRFPCSAAGITDTVAAWNAGAVNGRFFRMYMIEAQKVPAGLLSLYESGDALSVGVSVIKGMRRRGIAAAAVDAAKELAKNFGFAALAGQNRTDNAASIALCKKCGFCLEGRGVNAKGNEVFNWRLPL